MFVLVLITFLLLLSLSISTQDLNPIGCNIDGVDYRSRTQPFVNLIHQSQPFMSYTNSSSKATVDSHGYPTEDFTVDVQTLGIDLEGEYSISCKGNAKIKSLADGEITKQNYDTSTNTLTAVLSITKSDATTISLEFTGTSNGVQNLTVLLPGFTQSQSEELNPLMVEQLKSRCSIVRYLAMLPFQGDIITQWSKRATVETNPSWSTFCCPQMRSDSSVPWEVIIRIANAVGVDIWLNLPVTAEEDYYLELAKLLSSTLDPKINVYFEIGNEMFYGSSAQYENKLAANTSVTKDGDPFKLNYDNVDDGNVWGSRLLAYKTAVGFPQYFEKYFPNNVGKSKRVRPLLGAQSDDSRYIECLLEYLRQTQSEGLEETLQGFHLALYFGLGKWRNNDSLTEAQVLQALNESLASYQPQLKTAFYSHAAVAAWYGITEIRGYEGGEDTFGPTSLPGKVAANISPEMQTMVEEMYHTWHQYGFDTINYWHFGANIYDWRFGQWAIQRSMKDPNTPKVKALDAVRSKPRPKSVLGLSVPLKNYSAGHYLGYYSSEDHIVWVKVNSTYTYPLVAPKKSDYSLILYTATDNSNLTSCEIQVGFAYVGMKEPSYTSLKLKPTKSHTDFEPNDPVKISVSSSLTALRLKAVETEGCYFTSGSSKIASYVIGWLDVVEG